MLNNAFPLLNIINIIHLLYIIHRIKLNISSECEANSHQRKNASLRRPQKEKTVTNSKRMDKIQTNNASDNTYTPEARTGRIFPVLSCHSPRPAARRTGQNFLSRPAGQDRTEQARPGRYAGQV